MPKQPQAANDDIHPNHIAMNAAVTRWIEQANAMLDERAEPALKAREAQIERAMRDLDGPGAVPAHLEGLDVWDLLDGLGRIQVELGVIARRRAFVPVGPSSTACDDQFRSAVA